MTCRPRCIIVALLFSTISLTSAGATWNKIAQFTFTSFGRVSACYFFNADTGLIAFHSLNREFKVLRTTDGGITWNSVVTPIIGGGDGVVWFNELWFKNKLEGWAALKADGTSVGGGAWHTTDGGLTWVETTRKNQTMSIRQTRSALVIASNDPQEGLNFSTNNGNSYDIQIPGAQNCFAFANDTDGVVTGYDSTGFRVTKDGGLNWRGPQINILNECWGIYTLRRGTGTYVCVDEDGHNYGNESRAYRSDDYGKTWYTAAFLGVQTMGDIEGDDSILFVQNTGYVFGTPPGLYRSTDLGLHWTAIGGPNQSFDARIAVIPNTCGQIIYAFDSTGGVWQTTDGGDGFIPGGPGTIAISPNSLFDLDTLYCGDTLSRPIDIQQIGCRAPEPTAYTFTGPDARNYFTTVDSVVHVNFAPRQAGPSSASLVITISDGTSQTIQLSGVMRAGHPPLSIQTADQKTDSIGGLVSVPITPVGLHKPTDITVVIHYTGDLDYLGSFGISNKSLDLPNEQWYGRSKLYIASATPNVVSGYSNFNVYTDSSFAPKVSYDSMQIVYDAGCSYTYIEPIVSVLQGPAVCGSSTLSKFMRTNAILVNIWPDPTNGDVHISSNQDLGDVRVMVRNALGGIVSSEQVAISKDHSGRIVLPQMSGLYDVELERNGAHAHNRVIRVQ